MIILDTNVLSELMKSDPSRQVINWIAKYPALRLFITAITQAEILYGLELLPKGKRRTALEGAAVAMFEQEFGSRILSFDTEAARAFGPIAALRRAAGRAVTGFDAQIAAIASVHGATVATRNTTDFDGCGIAVVNPWNDAA